MTRYFTSSLCFERYGVVAGRIGGPEVHMKVQTAKTFSPNARIQHRVIEDKKNKPSSRVAEARFK
ncbi:MAG: hypothetical protein WBV28_12110 [Terracidiphilus sp.]